MSGQPVLVITGAYNAARFLEKTIESVRGQTHPHWTHVIVDDRSKDATWELIDEFSRRDSRIVGVRRSANSGRPAVPRNEGLRYAVERGIPFEYVCFLDADDYWEKDKLSNQLALFRQDPGLGLVYSRRFHELRGERLIPIQRRRIERVGDLLLFSHVSLSSVMLNWRLVQPFSPIFDEDPRLFAVEDTDLWLRLMSHGVRFGSTSEPEFVYRVIEGSASRGNLRTRLSRMFHLYLKAAAREKSPLGRARAASAFALKAGKIFYDQLVSS